MKSNFFKLIHTSIGTHVISEEEHQILENLNKIASMPSSAVIDELGSSDSGLSEDAVIERQKKYGLNVVVHEKKKTWFTHFLDALNNPFNYVLLVLAIVSAATKDENGTIIIVIMVLISVLIKFTQEFKSSKSAEMLRSMVHTQCTVFRMTTKGSEHVEIPIEQLVPGDIIHLAAGDVVPGDIRVICSKDLYISQSSLTGEAMPIEKNDKVINNGVISTTSNALELSNICFMGTTVDIGTATAIVVATGSKSYFGAIANKLTQNVAPTNFDLGINQVSWLLIRFMLIMAPAVLLISGLTKGNWLDAFLFALAIAVGLTPEMLPMVTTTNLAKGAVRMSKAKVIVKKLNSIQNLGAMNILCTDKTGTLTEDRIVLIKHLDVYGEESENVLELAILNSYFQSGLKNLMDEAILKDDELKNEIELEASWKKLDEIPFDFNRRRMSVILQQKSGEQLLICKGAIEEMIKCSRFVNTKTDEVEINDELKALIQAKTNEMNLDGLRVVAVGHRIFHRQDTELYTIDDESDLILDGYIAFLDPPKESAKLAIKALSENGVRIKVLTGDNDIVTRKICQEVGLVDDKIILGSDIIEMSDEDLAVLINQHDIFAKLTPIEKSRIVKLLRQQGNTVGYLGDGINDAPSLREADIGISVDSGVDIAKESADIILLEKDLMVLNDGVIEGRKVFANTMKYIKITSSSNFGNVFSLIGASAMFPFLPMLPLQILILNLVYDISQITIPWDNVDKDYLKKPRQWVANDIKRFMLYMGPCSSVFDYATFALMYFVFKANSIEHASLFQTGWFIESLCTQMMIVQLLRTEKIPFIQSQASKIVLFTAAVLLGIGMLLPITDFGKNLGFVTLPWQYYPWLIAILFCYLILAQLMKKYYIRRFKSWI